MKKKWLGYIDKRLQIYEKRCLLRILRKTKGNVRQAALLADVRRSRLYRMMKQHGIKIAEVRHADPR